ncbi:MAG: transcription termination factor NusB [Flavobacteriales bacterium]|jgi:transcription termination factor NusB
MESIDKSDLKDLQAFFKNRAKAIQDEKDLMLSIIGAHLEKIDQSKLSAVDAEQKKKEVIDLGKFIALYDQKITIEETVRESPSFIIRSHKKMIGVELLDLHSNLDVQKTEGYIDTLFREIEEKLKDISPAIHGVYKINFLGHVSFDTQKNEIKKDIIRCIKTSETDSTYLSSIKKSPGDILHLYTNETYNSGVLQKTEVLDAIAEKEEKMSQNQSTSKSSECWLLLEMSGTEESSAYATMDATIKDDVFTTSFEKVFIVDFFKSEIIELKTR